MYVENDREATGGNLLLRLVGCFFVLCCLNPWTSFSLNSMDSQPWALIFGVVFIFCARRVRVPPYFTVMFFAVLFGSIVSFALSSSPELDDIARFVASYASLLVVYLGFYNFLALYGFPRKIFLIAGWSWIAFAVIEAFYPAITSALSSQRTSEGRGLTSLAPEPTFFAIFLIFYSWILLKARSKELNFTDKVTLVVAISSVLLLARSAMGMLYIMVGVSVFLSFAFADNLLKGLIKKSHIVALIFSAISTVVVIFYINSVMPDSRIGKIISTFSELSADDIATIVRLDKSIFIRVAHATISLHAAIINAGLPGGIDTFVSQGREVAELWGKVFWDFTPGNKIQSWNGALFYELGVFGIIYYMAIILSSRKNNGALLAEIATVILFLTGAIPIAFPLVPMLFALWTYNSKNNAKMNQIV